MKHRSKLKKDYSSLTPQEVKAIMHDWVGFGKSIDPITSIAVAKDDPWLKYLADVHNIHGSVAVGILQIFVYETTNRDANRYDDTIADRQWISREILQDHLTVVRSSDFSGLKTKDIQAILDEVRAENPDKWLKLEKEPLLAKDLKFLQERFKVSPTVAPLILRLFQDWLGNDSVGLFPVWHFLRDLEWKIYYKKVYDRTHHKTIANVVTGMHYPDHHQHQSVFTSSPRKPGKLFTLTVLAPFIVATSFFILPSAGKRNVFSFLAELSMDMVMIFGSFFIYRYAYLAPKLKKYQKQYKI